MTHIMRINEMKSNQLGVKQYMNSKKPNIDSFVGDFTPFMYGGVLFYPVATQHRKNRDFDKVDNQISYTDWCKKFALKIGYNYDGFYDTAKEYGYGNCDVFACRIDNKIYYLIPTTYMFAEYPMKFASNYDESFMKELNKQLNAIFDNNK